MTSLYPIKFNPIVKERVWGSEIWEVSGVDGDISIASNGFLEENDINEITETYLGEFVGDAIYEKFGNEFPVLIKILNINESLSVQVHPSDEIAIERHDSYGKTECWYILEAKPTAKIFLGLNRDLTPTEFYDMCQKDTISEAMNIIVPKKGDFIFIEPGTLHAATGGITVAEIQQVSDVTYRVYDWGREHNPATAREMHLDLAIDCINYNKLELNAPVFLKSGVYLQTDTVKEGRGLLTDSKYFKVEFVEIGKKTKLESTDFLSFIIYFCIEGEATITGGGGTAKVLKGESIVVPAYLGEYSVENIGGNCRLLEITGKF